MLLVEMHELHQELQRQGFSSKDSNEIIGHILYDQMMDRPLVSDEDIQYTEDIVDIDDENDEGDLLDDDDPNGERPL
jgi:hypothetical protein